MGEPVDTRDDGRLREAQGEDEKPAALPTLPEATYEIDGELARGGLGRVLKARDTRLGRTVAIKELLPGGGDDDERRFVREAFVTASLEHPSIVPIHEAGRWPSGRAFYAMKLVSGRSLRQLIDDAGTFAERLALLPHVTAVAEAVAYAHTRGVIHRDLKPANVIVGQFGETVVIDWGLAKNVGSREEAKIVAKSAAPPGAEVTMIGDVLGTPAYMAPEQARGEAVGRQADVYALGALLYHVLAGVQPFDGVDVGTVSPVSGVIAPVSVAAPPPLEQRAPEVPIDLLAIVRTAMARDADARYPSAKELADDLKRFQTGQLVSTRHYSTASLALRWLRRHRPLVAVVAGALVLVAVLGAMAVGRVVRARTFAEAQRRLAEQRSADAERERAGAQELRAQAEARSNELILEQAEARAERDPTAALAWLKQYAPSPATWERERRVAAGAVSHPIARWIFRGHAGEVPVVRFSPDGKHVASGGADGTVRLWDLTTGEGRIVGRHDDVVQTIGFSPDGKWLLSGGNDRRISVWAVDGDAHHELARLDDMVTGLAYSPAGDVIAASSVDRTIRLWPAAGGEPRVLRGHELVIEGISFAPDGKSLASIGDDRTLRVWTVATGAARVFRIRDQPSAVAFAPDGSSVAVAEDSGVEVLDAQTGAARAWQPARSPNDVKAAGDGTFVYTDMDGSVHVWRPAAGAEVLLLGHEGEVLHVAVSPDDSLVASVGDDGTVRVWPLRRPQGEHLAVADEGACFLPDGTLAWSDRAKPAVHVGDKVIAAGGAVGTLLACSSRGDVAWAEDRALVVGGKPLHQFATPIYRIRWSPDGGLLAVTEGYEDTTIVDARTGAVRCVFPGKDTTTTAFAPGGAELAYSSGSSALLGDVASCTSRALYAHEHWVDAFAFSPDGAVLASVSADRRLALWTRATGAVRMLGGHELEILDVAFSHDGRWLATSSYDRTVRLWNAASGDARVLAGHTQAVRHVAFSADDTLVVSAGSDDTVRAWSVADGEVVAREDGTGANGLALAPDGRILAEDETGGRLFAPPPAARVPSSPADLAAWLDEQTTARVGKDGVLATP